VLDKKNVPMQAYGQSTINVQMFRNGAWHDAILKGVWYVPHANAILSQAVDQNGYSTTLNEKKIVIHSFRTSVFDLFNNG
jgi:hypothetical protein